jgi:hypothetical protein
MKIVLAIVVILLIAGSLFADYKWRQWMAARRAERHGPFGDEPSHPDRQ